MNRLYMASFDKHHDHKTLDSSKILFYTNFYSLFWDQLVISDAIINNNNAFRKFLTTLNKNGQYTINENAVAYFDEGIICPAVRNSFESFSKLRESQLAPDSLPPDFPDEGYVSCIDDIFKNKKEDFLQFKGVGVGKIFKDNLINKIKNATSLVYSKKYSNSELDKQVKLISNQILEYCKESNNVYYATILDTIINQHDNEKVRNIMQDFVSDCYLYNVPIHLGMEYCTFNNRHGIIYNETPINEDNSEVTAYEINLGTRGFDKKAINRLTPDIISDIKRDSMYSKLQNAIKGINSAKNLQEAFQDLKYALEVYTGRLGNTLSKREDADRHSNLQLTLSILSKKTPPYEQCIYWEMKTGALGGALRYPAIKLCVISKHDRCHLQTGEMVTQKQLLQTP